MITEPSASATPNGKSEMTPELWEEKDRAHNWSIETQVAFKGIIELMVGKIILPEGEVAKSAIDWAQGHFKPSITTSPVAKPDKDWDKLGRQEFKDRGDFLTKATKALDITTDEICVRLSVNSVKEITDFDKSWITLTQSTKSILTGGSKEIPED